MLSETKVMEDVRDKLQMENSGNHPDIALRGSYTEKVLQCTHDIYVNGNHGEMRYERKWKSLHKVLRTL